MIDQGAQLLGQHLDGAASLALKYEEWKQDDIDIARKLIPDLVLVLRGLLFDHQIRPSGDCRTCASAWPCPVVTLMHSLLKDPNNQFVALARRVHEEE